MPALLWLCFATFYVKDTSLSRRVRCLFDQPN